MFEIKQTHNQMISVIAATVPCMACTLPFLDMDNKTVENGSRILVEEKYMNGQYTLKYYVSEEVSANKYYRPITKMDLHPTRISKPYHKSKKVSKSNCSRRKYHNIHQPGRTNCSQRYQGK